MRDAAGVFASVAAALRELLPIEDMSRFYEPEFSSLFDSTTGLPHTSAHDQLERSRKEHTRRLRGGNRFGECIETFANGLRAFRNDDRTSHYQRIFVLRDQVLAQQYLGMLLCMLDQAPLAGLTSVWYEFLGSEFDGRIRNINYCPPQGFIPWHTNRYDALGWRLYLVDCPEDGASWFSASGGSTGKRLLDRSGWFYLFNLTETSPLWHCVGSVSHRVSCGVRLSPVTATALLRQVEAAGALEVETL